jgi:hypothetical protein
MPRPSEWFNRPFNAWTWPMHVLTALVILVIGGVVLSLVLAGCAGRPVIPGTYEGGDSPVRQGSSSSEFTEHTITLGDGRMVTCLTWSSWDFVNETMKSGVSCLEPVLE